MKRLLKTLAITGLAAAITGCATAPQQPKAYDTNKSRALNLVQAAGMRQINDQKVENEQYQRMTSGSIVADAGWTWSNYVNPAPGFSGGFGLGLGIATMLFKPDADSANNTLLAWMPVENAPDEKAARSALRDSIVLSVQKALSELGVSYSGPTLAQLASGTLMAVFVIEEPSKGCPVEQGAAPKTKFCGVTVAVRDMKNGVAPGAISQTSYPAYVTQVGRDRSAIRVYVAPDSKLNTLQIYQSVSEAMPSWMALYVAPKEARDAEGNEIPVPMVIHDGSIEMFVSPIDE